MAIDYSGIKRELNALVGTATRLITEIEAAERASGDSAFDLAMREVVGVHADATSASPSFATASGAPAETTDPTLGGATGDPNATTSPPSGTKAATTGTKTSDK